MPVRRRDRNVNVYFLPPSIPDGVTSLNPTLRRSQRGWEQYDQEIDHTLILDYHGDTYRSFLKSRGRPDVTNWRALPYSMNPYLGSAGWISGNPPWWAGPRNKAYEKFREKALGESTALGVFLAERTEGYNMVAKRVSGLYRAYKSLRRGNFRQFLRELSVKPKRKHRSTIRTAAGEASGLWLEYWFGWSPVVQDLWSISEVFAADPSPVPEWGASGQSLALASTASGSSSQDYGASTQQGMIICKTGGAIKVINEDMLIQSQLGLTNPAAIAWEVVPFSFVVDWFTNFGDVLQGISDFAGCRILTPYTTMYCKAHGDQVAGRRSDPSSWWRYGYVNSRHTRSGGLVKPVATRPSWLNYGQSKTRAATAASLLVQIFLDK